MNQEQMIHEIIKQVMSGMQAAQSAPSAPERKEAGVSKENYPLGQKMSDKIFSPTGKNLNDITLDKLISGEIKSEDIRIAPHTLEMQAQVAESVGRHAFARNLRRASELIAVPDERLLEIYNALRPYRSTKAELYAIADELKDKYNCHVNSNFVREAADVYEQRGRLRVD